jgi:hypothetical protein
MTPDRRCRYIWGADPEQPLSDAGFPPWPLSSRWRRSRGGTSGGSGRRQGRSRPHPFSSPRATVASGRARGMTLRGTVARGQHSKGEAERGGATFHGSASYVKAVLGGFRCGSCKENAPFTPIWQGFSGASATHVKKLLYLHTFCRT